MAVGDYGPFDFADFQKRQAALTVNRYFSRHYPTLKEELTFTPQRDTAPKIECSKVERREHWCWSGLWKALATLIAWGSFWWFYTKAMT